jgi:site-specific recombinase XerD
MARIRLRHVNTFIDRHGRSRIYYRPPGCKAIPLPGPVGSPEFMEAYNAAIALPRPKTGLMLKAGTFASLAMSYLNSTAFGEKREETQRSERGIINKLVDQYGSGPVATLTRDDVQRIIDKKANTPSAARNLLAVMRRLMAHAVKIEWRTNNPTIGIERPKIKGKGFRAWRDEDCRKYEATHPVGTRARLAYELLACTGLRRSDIVRVGRQHIRRLERPVLVGPYSLTHEIVLNQQKTDQDVGGLLVLPPLQAAFDAMPANNLTFLVTKNGTPLTKESFGNWFHDCCLEAGLVPLICDASNRPKGLASHGLRKRMAERLAHLGCGDEWVAAVLGHKDTRQVKIYTRGTNKSFMARSALRQLAEAEHDGTLNLQTSGENLQPRGQLIEKRGA